MTLPKLHIRDLFWLVLVVGMGCAWWVDRSKARRDGNAWKAAATLLRTMNDELIGKNSEWEVNGVPWP